MAQCYGRKVWETVEVSSGEEEVEEEYGRDGGEKEADEAWRWVTEASSWLR